MSFLLFTPLSQREPDIQPGMVLRAAPSEQRFYRITHVFPECVYYLVVTTATAFRDCGKPKRLEWLELKRVLEQEGSAWGHLELPGILTFVPPQESDRAKKIKKHWEWVERLVDDFESEPILRKKYTERLVTQAVALKVSWLTLQRQLNSYYYFGRSELALGGLAKGPKPTTFLEKSRRSPNAEVTLDADKPQVRTRKRAGARSEETRKRGEHIWTIDAQDVKDMEDTLRKELTPPCQVKFMKDIADVYLNGKFKERHPEVWKAWREDKKTDAPVSARIFSYRTRHAALTDAELANLHRPATPANTGHLHAKGPNHICEADGTGGRIWLMARTDDGWTNIGKCNIYIFIDRWSRFIHGVHITVVNGSSEQLSKALEYAFTPREARFARLGIHVSEKKWPRSHLPIELTTDRGPEFLSNRTVHNVVKHLRIRHRPLRAYHPDGKGIVEAAIKTLKKRMSKELTGAFSKAITDRETKTASEWAEAVAVESLRDAYRALIDIIIDYNNTPHSRLAQLGFVKEMGFVPTPRNAYVIGMEKITGVPASPLTPDQFARLLLTEEKANLYDGVLTHRSHQYTPADELALQSAREQPDLKRSVTVKVDADKLSLYMIVGANRLAHFKATSKTLASMGRMTPDEVDARKKVNATNTALYLAEKKREDAGKPPKQPKSHDDFPVEEVDEATRRDIRAREQDNVQRVLDGRPEAPPRAPPNTPTATPDGVSAVDHGEEVEEDWMEVKRRRDSERMQKFRESQRLDS